MFKCCLSMNRKVGVALADVWVAISLRACQDARLAHFKILYNPLRELFPRHMTC